MVTFSVSITRLLPNAGVVVSGDFVRGTFVTYQKKLSFYSSDNDIDSLWGERTILNR